MEENSALQEHKNDDKKCSEFELMAHTDAIQ